MNKKYMVSFIAVLGLFLIAWGGVSIGLQWVFGVIIPYLAVLVFVTGFIRKVMGWSRSAVPFAIPTTGGQTKSFALDPAFEIRLPGQQVRCRGAHGARDPDLPLAFPQHPHEAGRQASCPTSWRSSCGWARWRSTTPFSRCCCGTRGFSWIRCPGCVQLLENVDSFFRLEITYPQFQFSLPAVYLSGIVLLAAVVYLALRRIVIPSVRYISLASDFFPLLLIFGIAFSGILMRYVTKINIEAAKQLTMGLVTFHPTVPAGIDAIFYIHLFFVSTLLAYFPYSKLMHLGGVFLSPTRNMLANTRAYRHVNPWNYPVHVHTYEEYENDFREKMVEAGLPVDKPLEASAEAAEKE